MKKLLSILLLIISFGAQAQTTTNIKVGPADQWSGEWNAVVTVPDEYNDSVNKKYPTVIFFPGTGEVGTNIVALTSNGPHAALKSGVWDGRMNGDKAIVISLQPISIYPKEFQMAARIKTLKTNYRIDTTRLHFTGLSMGGWCSTTFVSESTLPQLAEWPASIVTFAGVVPDDNAPYPAAFNTYVSKGGKYLGFEQWRLDQRKVKELVDYMNIIKPASAIYVPTDYGNGGHCCWYMVYGGSGQQPQTFMLDGVQQNIYDWMGKQKRGTTTVTPPPPPPTPIIVNRLINYKCNCETIFYADPSDSTRGTWQTKKLP